MSGAPRTLRLGPLPRTESIKVTIVIPAALKAALDHYAAVHSRIHGEAVDATTLIPHMLQAFIARDRGFKAIANKPSKSTASQPSTSA